MITFSNGLIHEIELISAKKGLFKRTPVHADFLIAHSCIRGYGSFRGAKGSWFLQV
jgi:hypothetical protein